jgi:RNA polymerase sigma-70 factor (ECF subfamily)
MKVLMGQPPGIARYGGRGPIGAWLRVTAVRLAIDAANIAPGAASLTELLELSSDDAGPELATARRLYHERFRAALEESVKALSARDRTILRFHVVDGLHVDAIAAIYRVHRATVARWLVGIRGQVFENLRGRLNVEWKASPSELRSLIWMLRDQIHLTATRVLQQGP